ncbi:tRNA pseudouridine(55) synthase TruB [Desemzia sp. FAM 23991]|uniref:tRNA pseudouridine(55) synthase TruB n=1 Tax=unclassified Desemzia TaxID=2685243 RepID=UPI003888C368
MEGILPLWKERGMTSHDCVFKLRKILKTKKIGHTGTLDPDVDGVLPICIGRATKVVEYMMETGKAYVGEITIGFSTTTEDKSGEVVDSLPVTEVPSNDAIDQMMQDMTGNIIQIPPMYSAIKVNGRKLYEYARAGEEVERPKREVAIHRFVRTSEPVMNNEQQTVSWTFEVDCGKGTYVRTLAVDLGEKLGYPAHMSDLTRVKSGTFSVKDCLTLDQVAELMQEEMIEDRLYPLEYALGDMDTKEMTEELWEKVKNGAVLPIETFSKEVSFPVVLMYQGRARSIYGEHPTKPDLLKPIKVLRTSV